MRFADVAAPLGGTQLLRFLETWVHVYDMTADGLQKRPSNSGSFKPQTEPWRVHAKKRFAEGASTAVVSVELREQYGVELSRSNLAHIRRRSPGAK